MYHYDFCYKSTQEHANADCLSQLPLPHHTKDGEAVDVQVFQLAQIDSLPVTHCQFQRTTERDPVLSKVLQYTHQLWPAEVAEELKPYFNRREEELTQEGNCLLWGMRVVVPKPLQGLVLEELHRNHSRLFSCLPLSPYCWISVQGCVLFISYDLLPFADVVLLVHYHSDSTLVSRKDDN